MKIIAPLVLGFTGLLDPSTGFALEGKQCLQAWNLTAMYVTPVKEKLSTEFKQSIKSAFLIMENGAPLIAPDGQLKLRPCEKGVDRELYLKNTFDLAAWELIEEAGINNEIPIREAFFLRPAAGANQTVQKSLSVRDSMTTTTRPIPK